MSHPASITIQWVELTASDGGLLLSNPTALDVPAGSTVLHALLALGLNTEQVQARLAKRSVSVFGVHARADQLLHPGDRLELLDTLQVDPMVSRRRRAAHKARLEAAPAESKRARRSQKQG
ncbi:MAG: RnfH family protein [Limnobacter sp.]|uniref:RnfH family protein n=1 Tax=Limnobacter sp. TaxID=2003368 RepID=UPI00391A3DDF